MDGPLRGVTCTLATRTGYVAIDKQKARRIPWPGLERTHGRSGMGPMTGLSSLPEPGHQWNVQPMR